MNIRTFTLRRIRSIDQLEWKLAHNVPSAGWHVIIGGNGSGKSTVLRSLALILVGPSEAPALTQDWNDWLKKNTNFGSIYINVDEDKKYDHWEGQGRQLKKNYIYPGWA